MSDAIDSLARRVAGVILRAVLMWRRSPGDCRSVNASSVRDEAGQHAFHVMYATQTDDADEVVEEQVSVEAMGPQGEDGDYHWHAVTFAIDGGSGQLDLSSAVRVFDDDTPSTAAGFMHVVMMRAARLYNVELACDV